MEDMLADGLETMGDWLREFAAKSVVYHQGSGSVTLAGSRGRSDFGVSSIDGSPILTNVQAHDWIFTPTDLVISSASVTPAEGDRIVDGSVTYLVQAPAQGLPCWRFTDHYRNRVRVHTKRIA